VEELDKVVSEGDGGGLAPIGGSELAQQVGDVGRGGAMTYKQEGRDFGVGEWE
jgi:hypothetical protein